jgi:hypothetical protein
MFTVNTNYISDAKTYMYFKQLPKMKYVLMLYSTQIMGTPKLLDGKLPEGLRCLFPGSAIRVDFGVDINPNSTAVDLLRGDDSG